MPLGPSSHMANLWPEAYLNASVPGDPQPLEAASVSKGHTRYAHALLLR